MEQRTGRSGSDHCTQKPGVEGHLRCLGHTRESQAGDGQDDHDGSQGADLQELSEGQGLKTDCAIVEGADECDAAQDVHDDLAEGIADGLFGLGVADEQERAHGGDFPGGEHPGHVVAEHDCEHRTQEQEHDREEDGAAVALVSMLCLEVFHIPDRIDADAGTHDADDECHDQGQGVHVQAGLDLDAMSEGEFEHQGCRKLGDAQYQGDDVPVANGVSDDDHADSDADQGADDIYRP